MYSVTICPICRKNDFEPYLSCVDNTVSHETFSIIKCQSCNLLITSPRPETTNLGYYYLSDNYISHAKKTKSVVDLIYKVSRIYTLKWKLKLLKNHVDQKEKIKILDYGCGTGEFLKTCKADGHPVVGVEPSDKARTIASENDTIQILPTINNVVGKFNAITLFHVLEHIPEINEVLAKLTEALEKTGTVFIAVPNHESFDAKQYRNHWAAYDVPRHLWHFSKRNMTQLLANHGLEIIKVVPMKLDAFYVSIMSEKNMRDTGSITGFIKGLYNGLVSNFKADQNNHSSLIYIARKK
jgi:2-polyprenyl-3-methyl-5-hydroxy-6-metoxy-1,4-benzoquinol methylase